MGLYFLVLTLLLGTFEKEDKTDVDYTNLGIAMIEARELPFAVYFFTKAIESNPDNRVAFEKREEVWKTLDITPRRGTPISFPWKWAFVALFFVASAWIWTRKRWLIDIGVGAILLLPLLALLTEGLSPQIGVVVKPTLLYVEGKEGAPALSLTPVRGGEIVDVVGLSNDWVKVFTEEGKFGFIPKSAIRV